MRGSPWNGSPAPDSAQGRKMLEKVEVYVQVSFSLESGAPGSRAEAPRDASARSRHLRPFFTSDRVLWLAMSFLLRDDR